MSKKWTTQELDGAVDEVLATAYEAIQRLASDNSIVRWQLEQRVAGTLAALAYQELLKDRVAGENLSDAQLSEIRSEAWAAVTESIASAMRYKAVRDYLRAQKLIGSDAPIQPEGGRLALHLISGA